MIKFIPFKEVLAFSDLLTGEIFISSRIINDDKVEDVILHEAAHVFSGSCKHDDKWMESCRKLGLEENISLEDDILELYRERFSIPENIAGNIGNISGIQNILTDFFLLAAYRKFSQRILGNEGSWEFKVERGAANSSGGIGTNYGGTIKLFPVPKGSFPVVIEYLPSVTSFRSPQAQEATYRAFLAQMKQALGHARRKIQGIPGPDGGSITLDGNDLVTEGRDEYEKAVEFAISVGEPLGVYVL